MAVLFVIMFTAIAVLAILALLHNERAGMWKLVADHLADELRKHGWGDFHYGSTGQDAEVVAALAVYEKAKATDTNGRSDDTGSTCSETPHTWDS